MVNAESQIVSQTLPRINRSKDLLVESIQGKYIIQQQIPSCGLLKAAINLAPVTALKKYTPELRNIDFSFNTPITIGKEATALNQMLSNIMYNVTTNPKYNWVSRGVIASRGGEYLWLANTYLNKAGEKIHIFEYFLYNDSKPKLHDTESGILVLSTSKTTDNDAYAVKNFLNNLGLNVILSLHEQNPAKRPKMRAVDTIQKLEKTISELKQQTEDELAKKEKKDAIIFEQAQKHLKYHKEARDELAKKDVAIGKLKQQIQESEEALAKKDVAIRELKQKLEAEIVGRQKLLIEIFEILDKAIFKVPAIRNAMNTIHAYMENK